MQRLAVCLTGVISAVCLLAACSVQEPASFDAPVLLPPPSALAVVKAADSSLGYVRATDFADALPHQRVVRDSLASSINLSPSGLVPGLAGCALAVYRVPVDGNGPLSLHLEWSTPASSGQAWAAFANRTSQRWEWQRLEDPAGPVTLADSASYLDADGTAMLALLVTSTGSAFCDLAWFSLDVQQTLGWQQLRIGEWVADGAPANTQLCQTRLVNGKPAVYFRSGALRLAYSSSSSGALLSDWQTLDNVSGTWLADVDGKYCFAYSASNGSSDELHYSYSADPASGFSDELVASGGDYYDVRLGEVGGRPAISYCDDGATLGTVEPRYASSTAASGGTWTSGVVSADPITLAISEGVSAPLDYMGKPLLGYAVDSGDFIAAIGKVASPAQPSDWDLLNLGGGDDDAVRAFMLDGKPAFACAGYIVSSPDTHIWLYHLSGSDASAPGDWSGSELDQLGLSSITSLDFMPRSGELGMAILRNVVPGTALSLERELRLWSSSSLLNSADEWQSERLSKDLGTGSALSFVEVEGQPAFARLTVQNSGSFAAKTWVLLDWWRLVP